MQNNEIVLTAPNKPEMELVVSEVASSIANILELSIEQIDEIKMAIIEACLNSFEHSHSKDNIVTVRFYPEEDQLKIVIQDNGEGFNPEKITSPNIDELMAGKSKKYRGWGLKIMQSLMDEVSIKSDSNGTTVTLIKKKNRLDKKKETCK